MALTHSNPNQNQVSQSQVSAASGIGFLWGFAGLLGFQLLGEVIVRLLAWPVPGPVIGLLLMLTFLLVRRYLQQPEPQALLSVSSLLLAHLSLLFVPAGVGIMTHLERLKAQWLPISVALILASVITLVVTAWSLVWLMRVFNKPEPE